MPNAVRSAHAEDAPAILDVLVSAFSLRDNPARTRTMVHLAENDWRNFLVLEDEDDIQAVAHIRPDRLRVGRTAVLKGDLGYVGVRPELQGCGVGTTLVKASVEWMRNNGFHISRLGGLMRYYSRFGYEPFIRRYITIPVAPMGSKMKGRRWSEIRALSPELAARVRRFDPSRDHAARHALLVSFYKQRSGAWVFSETLGPAPAGGPNPKGLEFVYEESGTVCGYIRGSIRPPEAGAAPSPCVEEFIADLDRPETVEALFKRFIAAVAEHAPTEIAARLPYDQRLYAALVRADIAFNLHEMHQAADGNMIQVIDLRKTLESIAPELSDRLKAAGVPPWEGVVRFDLPGQTASIRVAAANVLPATDEDKPSEIVPASQAQFVQWLFGIAGFAEFAGADSVAPTVRAVLGACFPRLPCASGPWG